MPDFNFSPANLIGNLLFSSIGFVAFAYAKKMGKFLMMAQGAVLMVFPYFVSDTFWMYVVGAGLTAWVWFTRND